MYAYEQGHGRQVDEIDVIEKRERKPQWQSVREQ